MPYIDSKTDRREKLRCGESALIAGELNYQIFYYVKHGGFDKEIIRFFVKRFLGDKPNYQRYNDMTGALVRCAKEINRRLKLNANFLLDVMESYNDEIAKYEDEKIISNSDVE